MGTTIGQTFTLGTAAVVVDLREEEETEFQIVGIAGGDSVTVTRSFDGSNFVPHFVLTNMLNDITSITADNIFLCDAAGYLKFTKTGTGSTPAVTIRRGF